MKMTKEQYIKDLERTIRNLDNYIKALEETIRDLDNYIKALESHIKALNMLEQIKNARTN